MANNENSSKMMLLAFFKGIKEFGLEEALTRISRLIDGDVDETDIKMIAVAMVSLVTIFIPELMANEDFINALSNVMEETPKSELEERINYAIDLCKREYGDLE